MIWVGIGVSAVIILASIGWTAFRPAAGVEVPVMANASDHVLEGSELPTSGQHYA